MMSLCNDCPLAVNCSFFLANRALMLMHRNFGEEIQIMVTSCSKKDAKINPENPVKPSKKTQKVRLTHLNQEKTGIIVGKTGEYLDIKLDSGEDLMYLPGDVQLIEE